MMENITTRDAADAALKKLSQLKSQAEECAKAEAEARADREAAELLIDNAENAIVKWAKKDRAAWPGKSLTLTHGVISFQVSPGKVKLIKTVAATFDAVIDLLAKSRSKALTQLLRPRRPLLDKELITAEFTDGRLTNADLEKVGLRVDKPETCKIETI